MHKRRIIGSVIAAVLSIFLINRYSQYVMVWQVNPQIDVSGIKLMMKENRVKDLLGEEEEYIPGYAGCCYLLKYCSKGIFLTFLGDIDTDFFHKVSEIKITYEDYKIFNIKVGDDCEKALNILRRQGFEQKEGLSGYWKMNMYIEIEKHYDKVESITIGIRDKTAGSRVY